LYVVDHQRLAAARDVANQRRDHTVGLISQRDVVEDRGVFGSSALFSGEMPPVRVVAERQDTARGTSVFEREGEQFAQQLGQPELGRDRVPDLDDRVPRSDALQRRNLRFDREPATHRTDARCDRRGQRLA